MSLRLKLAFASPTTPTHFRFFESQPLAGMEILWTIPRLSYERLFEQFADWIRGGVAAANCNWAEFTFRQNKCCLRRQLNYLDGPCAEERCLEVGKGKGKCRTRLCPFVMTYCVMDPGGGPQAVSSSESFSSWLNCDACKCSPQLTTQK